MNALLQCLFHCACVRAQWRGGCGGDITMRAALAALLAEYQSNRCEVILPHAFLGALRCEMSYVKDLFTAQQDCLEVLRHLLTAHTKELTVSQSRGLWTDGVLLCCVGAAAPVDGSVVAVDVVRHVKETLTGEQALTEAPPLLIVRVSNGDADGGGEYRAGASASWPADKVDLAQCIRPVSKVGGVPTVPPSAVYVIRGYVAYAQGGASPCASRRGSHCCAYIRHDADVEALEHPPDAFPYLIFLEHVEACAGEALADPGHHLSREQCAMEGPAVPWQPGSPGKEDRRSKMEGGPAASHRRRAPPWASGSRPTRQSGPGPSPPGPGSGRAPLGSPVGMER